MPETFGSIIDYVANQLHGFVTDAPMYATTTTVMQANSLTVGLDLPSQSQPQGMVEIDGELIYVSAFDAQTRTATIPAWGRGQEGTPAAAHSSGRKVVIHPKYPRRRIGMAINQVVAAICPPLHGVARGTFSVDVQVWEYALPANTRNLLRVEARPFGSDAYDWSWFPSAYIKRDSGDPVLHVDSLPPNFEVRYTVATNPVALVDESDLFTATGLPESCIDLVSLGAIPRLISVNELARQQLNSVESSERATLVPSGSGTAAARFYMQMFNDRLAAEVKRQRQEYPLTVRRSV